jgi:thiamine-phosphate pyrophosphorylase
VGQVTLPFFCIGGITPERISEVTQHGGSRVCVVSYLLQAADPAAAARNILSRLGTSSQLKDADRS